MGTALKVVGSLAILRTNSGPDRYLYHGSFVGDGFTEESVKHAISVGLVEEVEVGDVETPAEADETPTQSWNNDRIIAWAAEQEPPIVLVNPDDADKAPTKAHMLTAIAAELEARKAQQ